MIYEVIKNLGTGQVDVSDSKINKSFTYDYLVITDHHDTPQSILKQAKSKGLPVYGDFSETGIPLQSISIDRWDQNNIKCVPSSKLPIKKQGSYAAWKYEVTYATKQSGGSDSGDDEQNPATNFNASIKQYQQSTNQFYFQSHLSKPQFNRDYTNRTTIIQNGIGDYLMYETQLKNLIITIDFPIKSSKISKYTSTLIPQYVGSVSRNDITVAGIDFKAGQVRLNAMTVSGSSQQQTATVHVQLQMQVQKPVAFEVFPDMSYYVLRQTSDGVRKVRVQKWTASQQMAKKVSEQLWIDKQKGLGYFSESQSPKYIRGTHYEYYQQKVLLNASSRYYKMQPNHAPDMDDPNLGKTYVITSPVKSWKGLNLPKKLK